MKKGNDVKMFTNFVESLNMEEYQQLCLFCKAGLSKAVIFGKKDVPEMSAVVDKIEWAAAAAVWTGILRNRLWESFTFIVIFIRKSLLIIIKI